MPVGTYRVDRLTQGISAGDSTHQDSSASLGGQWKSATSGVFGRTKTGGLRWESALLFSLRPTRLRRDQLWIPKGSIINSSKLIFTPTSTSTSSASGRLATIKPDGLWDTQEPIANRKYNNFGFYTYMRFETSGGTLVGQTSSNPPHNYNYPFSRWNRDVGDDEVGMTILTSAALPINNAIARIGAEGIVIGFNVFMDIYAVDAQQDRVGSPLATSNAVSMSTLNVGDAANTTFTFSIPYIPAAGERLLGVIRTTMPKPYTLGNLLVGITNNVPNNNGSLQFTGDYEGLMDAFYMNITRFPRANQLNNDNADPDIFDGRSSGIPSNSWATGVEYTNFADGGFPPSALVQTWIDSEFYDDGGKILFCWGTTFAFTAENTEHEFDLVELAGETDVKLVVDFTPPKKTFVFLT